VPERRQDDHVVRYRLNKMEEELKDTNNKVGQVQKDVASLKDDISREFTDLRKTLFERPIFVTYELLKIELEGRDSALEGIKRDHHELKQSISENSSNSVSAARHRTTIALTLFVAIMAPLIINYIEGK
jgi:chromosome segregation ATPase